MKTPRSRGHVALWIIGLLVLAAGIVALGLGVWFFGSAATTPSSTFFADPEGTMDRTRNAAFLGVGLFSLGAMIAPVGGVMTLVAGILEVYRPREPVALASS
jgi:MFS family permease